MGDENASEKPDNQLQPEEVLLIVKWRPEGGTPVPGQENRRIRGKVLDVRCQTLGKFAGLDALFELLTNIAAKKSSPRSW